MNLVTQFKRCNAFFEEICENCCILTSVLLLGLIYYFTICELLWAVSVFFHYENAAFGPILLRLDSGEWLNVLLVMSCRVVIQRWSEERTLEIKGVFELFRMMWC
jgi:hypothetical protein